MSEPADLRVSDEERERAAEEIREHFGAGRLTETELSDRISAAYRAQTQQELREIRADLPQLPAPLAEQRSEQIQRRAQLQRRLLQQTGGGLLPFVICTAIWFAAGARGAFWPVWILLAVLVPLLRNGWRLFGPAPELERVEQDLSRADRRASRRSARRRRRPG